MCLSTSQLPCLRRGSPTCWEAERTKILFSLGLAHSTFKQSSQQQPGGNSSEARWACAFREAGKGFSLSLGMLQSIIRSSSKQCASKEAALLWSVFHYFHWSTCTCWTVVILRRDIRRRRFKVYYCRRMNKSFGFFCLPSKQNSNPMKN